MSQTVTAVYEKGMLRPLINLQLAENQTVKITIVAEAQPARQLRPYGLCKGEFVVPADFNDPLPDYILADFEGG